MLASPISAVSALSVPVAVIWRPLATAWLTLADTSPKLELLMSPVLPVAAVSMVA